MFEGRKSEKINENKTIMLQTLYISNFLFLMKKIIIY